MDGQQIMTVICVAVAVWGWVTCHVALSAVERRAKQDGIRNRRLAQHRRLQRLRRQWMREGTEEAHQKAYELELLEISNSDLWDDRAYWFANDGIDCCTNPA